MRSGILGSWVAVLAWPLFLVTPALAGAATQESPHSTAVAYLPAKCSALADTDMSKIPDAPTQIVSATAIKEAGDVPAYCQVQGYVAPNVGFRVGLPSKWNGKFVEIGCGGYCGVLNDDYWIGCQSALRKGYACIISDMGHSGTGDDGLWAYGNLQAKVDWGFRATHVAALAGKAITERYYERGPNKSYYMGCSTGGRQALLEAQHFPWDFDGIVAGAPPTDMSTLLMTFAWGDRVTHDSEAKPLLGSTELRLLTAAAVAKCDLDDGVKDGVIGNPLRCNFDPSELACKAGRTENCLTAAQVTAAQKVYAGPLASDGSKLSLGGPLPGSEYGGEMEYPNDWSMAYVGRDGKPAYYEKLMTAGFRFLFFSPDAGPTWKLSDFDFDRDSKRLGIMESLYDAGNPDLRKFKKAGGKMIAYQGYNDISVLPRSTIDYYQTVERTMGGAKATQDFFRLFMLPGVQHCSGGVGADAADFLGYLEAWVERAEAPNVILAAHLKETPATFDYPYREFPADASKLAFTRPVYPFPLRAKYKGKGDPNDAANFGPVDVEADQPNR